MKKKILDSILVLCLGTVLIPATLLAHRVLLFAWVEDGMVHAEGGFGGGKPAKNCPIKALGTDEVLIFSGKTDEAGRVVFKVPDGHASAMVLTLDAGPGHLGKWTIEAGEFSPEAGPVKIDETPAHKALEKGVAPGKILAGIGVIFGLALGLGMLKKKKGSPND